MVKSKQLKQSAEAIGQDVVRFLSELIQIPSFCGQEQHAMNYLYEKFNKLDVKVEKIPLSDSIKSDPDYSSPIPDIMYQGRYNLRIVKKGGSGGKVLLNAHVDTVPPSEGMDNPYAGFFRDGVVYGRGACDDKGSIAVIYGAFLLLQTLDIQLPGDVVAHIVVEEENGGNGSLAMSRQGEKADFCIVLEPTENKILTSIRGAVWFKMEFIGRAGHSGQSGQTRSALLMAHEAILRLTAYHQELLKQSKGIDLFDRYENPMPLTFGRLQAGNWPASAPSYAVLEGVLGFLPNKTKEQICIEFGKALIEQDNYLNRENFKLVFTYRHDCSVVSPEHPLIGRLLSSNQSLGFQSGIDAMPASCDAWFYNNQLGIPTIVYGPGTLKVAHSKNEQIKISEVIECCMVLVDFLSDRMETKNESVG